MVHKGILEQGQDVYQHVSLVLQVTAGTLTALLLGIQPPQRHIACALHASCQDALQQHAAARVTTYSLLVQFGIMVSVILCRSAPGDERSAASAMTHQIMREVRQLFLEGILVRVIRFHLLQACPQRKDIVLHTVKVLVQLKLFLLPSNIPRRGR